MGDVNTFDEYDVVVVGHGISGLSTALSAHEHGAKPVVLEKSPAEERGGNTRFAGGVFRFPMEDPEAVADELYVDHELDTYTEGDYLDDLNETTGGRADPALCEVLVENAYETVKWLTDHGVQWVQWRADTSSANLSGGHVGILQATGENGIYDGGEGVVETLSTRLSESDIDVHYRTEFRKVETDDSNEVTRALAVGPDGKVAYETDAIVVCAGSYEASPEKRTRYFGPSGDRYIVRGSRYNTGEALEAAMSAGAMGAGEWGGGHKALLDANSPPVEAGRTRVNGYQYGVILNERGERFLDEGEDFLLKTYAKFGKAVFDQPKNRAYVVFDSTVDDLIWSQMGTEPVEADTLTALFERVGIEEPEAARETIEKFNDATNADRSSLDPSTLDGNRTEGLRPDKTNWALPVNEPPFGCFPVQTGLTWAFGGLKIDTESRVIDTRGEPIPGLWAVGNSTAEFFYGNYPGGAALMRGGVFGRRAGRGAARYVQDQ